MPLQQNIFAAGNFTMAKAGNLFGLNGTFGDLDMLVRFLTEIVDDFRRFVDEIWPF